MSGASKRAYTTEVLIFSAYKSGLLTSFCLCSPFYSILLLASSSSPPLVFVSWATSCVPSSFVPLTCLNSRPVRGPWNACRISGWEICEKSARVGKQVPTSISFNYLGPANADLHFVVRTPLRQIFHFPLRLHPAYMIWGTEVFLIWRNRPIYGSWWIYIFVW